MILLQGFVYECVGSRCVYCVFGAPVSLSLDIHGLPMSLVIQPVSLTVEKPALVDLMIYVLVA